VRRAARVLLLLPLLAACALDAGPPDVARPAAAEQPAGQPADAVSLLAGVAAAAEAAGSVRYEAVSEGAVAGEPVEVQGRLSGVLDLAADAGTGELELPALAEMAAEADAAGEPSAGDDLSAMARLSLSWTATDVTVAVDGERHTAPRDREDSSVVARVPGEPAGLLDAVAAATDVVVAGQEDVDGIPTTRLTAGVDPQAAVDAGLGTQAQLSIAALPSLPVEVWVDAEGRAARIRYEAGVPSLQGGTRTMTTTYDYRGWGEPVDVTP
jgi:hypothetical protein